MTEIITLPGIGNSGAAHWQTLWEQSHSNITRFAPSSWDQPYLADWIEALDREISKCAEPPVLIAHSLACLLVPHWAKTTSQSIAGVVLVAVPDPNGSAFPEAAAGFGNTPSEKLPCPSLVIASSNDPYGSLEYARTQAAHWGSQVVDAGALGHINESSNLGDWPQGYELITDFIAKL